MKILMVSIPSLHFFRWTEQLKDAGHEIYWFDVTGMSEPVKRINWVKQKVKWKLKYNYLGRFFIKKYFPKIYTTIQKHNENNILIVFENYLREVKPDVVHSFALQLSCIPILSVMNKYANLKWIFSSWGSDVFYSKKIGIEDVKLIECLKRIDYLITDCNRDSEIAFNKGFEKKFLGVFPGNGGIEFETNAIELNSVKRKIILIKAYNDQIGRGINIVKALDDELITLLKDYEVIIFGADESVQKYIKEQEDFKKIKYTLYLKSSFIPNSDLIRLMGKCYIYIANSLSDGIPNTLIEAMGMGAFPIQSNPGNVTEEIIENGINGFLINDVEDVFEIKRLILEALNNEELLTEALLYNTKTMKDKYERVKVRKQILKIYE